MTPRPSSIDPAWPAPAHEAGEAFEPGISLGELAQALRRGWMLIIGGALLAGGLGLGVAFLIPPTYTARTSFLPPQQQQSSASAAISSLGALAGLAGGVAGIKTPADQFIALMQSVQVSNQIIERFKLMAVYEARYLEDARKVLANKVRISAGKKDGLIYVEVDDESAERSAAIANSYVEELRALNTTLAVTEAQQRRKFFEQQLQATKEKLTAAQIALESTGFSAGALKVEPRAASEAYARLRAEVATAEVKLQTLRGSLADGTPEVVQQQALLGALQANLARLEASSNQSRGNADYVGRYREFKYQETLFEMFARQYEVARVDESREGALIQVMDVATPPERRSRPKRAFIALGTSVLAGLLLSCWVLLRASRDRQSLPPLPSSPGVPAVA